MQIGMLALFLLLLLGNIDIIIQSHVLVKNFRQMHNFCHPPISPNVYIAQTVIIRFPLNSIIDIQAIHTSCMTILSTSFDLLRHLLIPVYGIDPKYISGHSLTQWLFPSLHRLYESNDEPCITQYIHCRQVTYMQIHDTSWEGDFLPQNTIGTVT